MSFLNNTNAKVIQGLTGGKIIREELVLFSDRLPKENPLIVRASFPQFKRITKAELKVNLLAADKFIPINAWRLTDIRVNNKSFTPSHHLNSVTLIQNLNQTAIAKRGEIIKRGNIIQTLNTGENTFQIFRDAPFGTGFVLDQVFAEIKIILEGELESNPVALGAGALSSISSNLKNFEFLTSDKVKANTPLAIALLVIFAIIVIGLAIVLTKSRGITSDVKDTTESVSNIDN